MKYIVRLLIASAILTGILIGSTGAFAQARQIPNPAIEIG